MTAAGGFLLSALLNGFIFWSELDLNYFTIATAADVVISGFIPITVLAASAVAGDLFRRFGGLRAVMSSNADLFDGHLYDAVAEGALKPYLLPLGAFLGLISFVALAIIHVMTLEGPPDKRNYWVDTHRFALSEKLPTACGKVGRLLWVGTNSAVVGCKNGEIVVIHNPQDLVTTTDTNTLPDDRKVTAPGSPGAPGPPASPTSPSSERSPAPPPPGVTYLPAAIAHPEVALAMAMKGTVTNESGLSKADFRAFSAACECQKAC